MGWSGGLAEWIEGNTAYISVVFSWQIQDAYQKAIYFKSLGYDVMIGGGILQYNENYKIFENVARVDSYYPDAIGIHNQEATFTTRGCVRNCPFCIVPKSEGAFVELNDFPIRPIICDNNFLASSKKHFDSVIDKLKPLKNIDFNQGLDARLLTKYQAERLAELNIKVIRLAWDHISIEKQWMTAYDLLLSAGFKPRNIQSYVLINFNDTPEDALYRLQTIKNLGALPNPMRYQPLDSVKRNQYIHPNWTEYELKNYMRYWARLRYLEHIPFEDYIITKKRKDNHEKFNVSFG